MSGSYGNALVHVQNGEGPGREREREQFCIANLCDSPAYGCSGYRQAVFFEKVCGGKICLRLTLIIRTFFLRFSEPLKPLWTCVLHPGDAMMNVPSRERLVYRFPWSFPCSAELTSQTTSSNRVQSGVHSVKPRRQ